MKTLLLLALLLAVGFPTAQAQSQAVSRALAHLDAQRDAFGLTAADLADVAVTDEVVSTRTGLTHVYLRQTVHGIEVYNAPANANVAADGRVVGAFSDFVPNLASRAASEPVPSLDAGAAVAAAVRYLDLEMRDVPSVIEPADERHRLMLSEAGVSLDPIPAQLVYFVTETGALRLAWDLAIYQLDAQHAWNLQIDAETGAVLGKGDWVVQDEWGSPEPELDDYRPLAPSPAQGARASGSYTVWALPLESPNHGPRTVEVNPHDPTASPSGWHDDGDATYTITRGNNVYAYEDRNDANVPGYAPDGGGSLIFDFPVDFEQQPIDYQDAVITNLFYWNNITHDVLLGYGFDEAAGNFQQTNFTAAGLGDDYVRAEAQDGSGTNNANFFTPQDGQRPRMQMYEWEAPPQLGITAPDEIVGFYINQQAAFGPAFPSDPEPTAIVPVVDFGDPFFETGAGIGCEFPANDIDIEGNIALVQRGDCGFWEKVNNLQDAGAIGVIVHNCEPGATGCSPSSPGEGIVTMGAGDNDPDDIEIPSTFIRQSDGLLFVDNADELQGYVQLVPINRDSDLDAGVIVHEYGHGVSNRLTGGPSNANCLNGDEQMGEGWSDYLGLMLTMREGDTAAQRRGVGTYLEFQETDGGGIRPYPYSTDMGINPTTYGTAQDYSIPHGVGSVWAQMLWEMTWNLIDEYGFDADIYAGTGGNNVALQLVMTGMQMQPCNPGFVTGRDGILMADEALYDGANAEAIWTAFAKRGLGWSAEQGSVGSITDGVEAFDLPPFLTSSEGGAASLPNGYRLTAAYPNPFASESRFTLEVAEAQDVRVAVYDVVGREVARLHDGPLAAGSRHAFVVEGARFATGVYLVRVTGSDFAETHRVTLLR